MKNTAVVPGLRDQLAYTSSPNRGKGTLMVWAFIATLVLDVLNLQNIYNVSHKISLFNGILFHAIQATLWISTALFSKELLCYTATSRSNTNRTSGKFYDDKHLKSTH
jgi:hypothetical protein